MFSHTAAPPKVYVLVFHLDAMKDFASHLQQILVFHHTTAPLKVYLLVFYLDATRDFASHLRQIPVFVNTTAQTGSDSCDSSALLSNDYRSTLCLFCYTFASQ